MLCTYVNNFLLNSNLDIDVVVAHTIDRERADMLVLSEVARGQRTDMEQLSSKCMTPENQDRPHLVGTQKGVIGAEYLKYI